jgi:uncharacterized protein YbjT (DUF2867 family)
LFKVADRGLRLVILVAGGSGRLGRIVVERLLRAGASVRVLSRRPDAGATGAPEVIVGDVRDRGAVQRAMSGARVVISAMSAFGMKGVSPRQVDLDGNLGLIAAAEEAGVERFVLLSMRGASAHHPMELARMKHGAEQRLMQSKLAWSILRPSPFTETFQAVMCAPLLDKGQTAVFGVASNPVNFVSVRDVARLVETAALTDELLGATVDIGGPQNLSLVQFVEAFAAAVGVSGPIKHIPRPAMRVLSQVARLFNPTFARAVQAGVVMDTTDMTFDATALARRFPAISFATVAEVAQRDYARLPAGARVTA